MKTYVTKFYNVIILSQYCEGINDYEKMSVIWKMYKVIKAYKKSYKRINIYNKGRLNLKFKERREGL